MNQPMEMIQRKMLSRFLVRGGNYQYRWLQDCKLYPKLNCFNHFRAPYSGGFRLHHLELPTTQSCSHITIRVTVDDVSKKKVFNKPK